VARLSWYERLPEGEIEEVLAVLRAASTGDGWPEIAPADPMPRQFRTGQHLVAYGTGDIAGQLVGYAHLNTAGDAFGRPVAEVIVHPAHRRDGIGSAMVEELARRAAGSPLRIWSHGDHPGATRIAEKFGLRKARQLLTLRVDLDAPDTPPLSVPNWPPGITVRTFLAGQDEAEVVQVNRRAFAWHPEQATLTVEDIMAIEAEDWFDPEGFFLAADAQERLLGFHWTKVHRSEPPVGEVYVVGVDPEAHGLGLGKALTLAGLHHLRRRGLSTVILYVESDNAAALALYRHLGFRGIGADIQYELVSQP
jgi:mycothiol synthase